ncbi:MAG: DUF4442 domain-containing protein [Gemmatimonadales bacterium]|nr:MAG: DUF4442 domain-containing protein [Gemmatimonadales bacterium]
MDHPPPAADPRPADANPAGPDPADPAAPGATLLQQWRRLSRFPGGTLLFSRLLGFKVPYSGALGARVRILEPGHAVVTLRVRRGVRNHLGSAHAVALTNLGELATGLSVLTALPTGVRGIVLRLESEYLKKGRGLLTAESRWTPPAGDVPFPAGAGGSLDHWAETVIRDGEGSEVARVRALWRLGRKE